MEKKGRIEATTILLNTRCYRFPDYEYEEKDKVYSTKNNMN
jgi:hypothetical protein